MSGFTATAGGKDMAMVSQGWTNARVAAFVREPDRHELSDPIVDVATGIFLRAVPNRPPDAGSSDPSSWATTVSRVLLTDEELLAWEGVGVTPRRRNEWLLGRLVVKEAVRSYLLQEGCHTVGLQGVSIASTKLGAPYVRSVPGVSQVALPAISIAHSPATVLAAAAAPGTRLGVDIESRDRPVATLARVLEARESQLLDSASLTVIDALVAKEAAAKALGTGLGGSLRRWPIAAVVPGPLPLVVIDPPDGHDGQVTVELLFTGGSVVAVAKCEPHH